MPDQFEPKGFSALIAHEAREGFEPWSLRGQGLGLPIVDHLQAVLAPPQEAIRRDEGLCRVLADPPGLGEGGERAAGVCAPQFRDATAPDQLLRLSEKLDLTNAAASELDVVAAHRNRSVALMGVDLALDRMNVADSSEIQIAPPDIGPQMSEEIGAGLEVAGDR